MSALEIVTAASDPAFYGRVSYIALKVAQMVASEAPGHPNHANRVQYANRIFQGSDGAILLAQHVATNPAIATALAVGPEEPTDEDIEFVLTAIWDARSNAFGPSQPQPLPVE